MKVYPAHLARRAFVHGGKIFPEETMRNYLVIAVVVFGSVALACATATAEAINLDINSDLRGDFNATYAPTTGDFANQTFNGLNVDIGDDLTYNWTNLLNSEGEAVPGVSFSVDLSGATSPNWTADYEIYRTDPLNCVNCNALQRDRLYDLDNSSPKFGFAGLDSGKLYDITLFMSSMSADGELYYTTHFDLLDGDDIDETRTTTTAGSDHTDDTFVEGADYVTFQVSGSSAYTFQSRKRDNVSNSYAMLGGARIELIPEPSALILLLSSLVGMLLWRRRK